MSSSSASTVMIASAKAETFEVVGGRADAGVVIVCDHAGNELPPHYGSLGLADSELQRHIAYDIGAAAVTRGLAAALGVPAILTRYSRLLIDCNRGQDDPTQIMRISDGAVIPGNRHLDAGERERRRRLYYEPYHTAIDDVLERCLATGVTPSLISMHSFTESWKGTPRPWHVGILWDRDPRLAVPLLDAFHAEGDLIVGDNQPYVGSLEGDCLWQHATTRGLPGALIEIRQDLIRDSTGQAAWTARLVKVIESLRNRPDLQIRLGNEATAANHGDHTMPKELDPATETALQAAAYRKLVAHLRQRTDVQNIDLMNLAGFCRNCLANWLQEAASEKGEPMSKDEAREIVYGMPYKEWQAKYQTEASPAQKAAFEKSKPQGH